MVVAAAEQARRIVDAVEDDPQGRIDVAARFYDDRPDRASIRTYRRAELAFMRWQVRRGVLAPVSSAHPGSAWWRAVNKELLLDAWEAERLVAGAAGEVDRSAVGFWLEFLRAPSPESWYRAHNSSVVAGYLNHRHLVDAELPIERFFMDVALGRVIFVHSLIMNPRLALGRHLWPVGRLLGDPRLRGADLFLSLRKVLPQAYPLPDLSIDDVLKSENLAGRLIDYGVSLPRAQALYEFAAADLGEPALLAFVAEGNLVYAWPYEDRSAWAAPRFRGLSRLVSRLTSAEDLGPDGVGGSGTGTPRDGGPR